MTPQRIKELRHMCAAAKWDSVSDSVAPGSGAPVKAFLESARAGMVELLDAYEEAREDLEFGKYKPGPGDLS